MSGFLKALGFVRSGVGGEWIDTRGGRVTLTAAAVVVYVVAFSPLYGSVGIGVCALSLLPVVVIAWLLGSFGGLLAGVASLPVNAALLGANGEDGWSILLEAETVEGPALIIVVGAVVGILRDLGIRVERQLAESREIEARLRDRETRFRTLFEETRDAVCILDADEGFEEVNGAMCDLLEYPERDLMERELEELVADPASLREVREELESTGSVRNHDIALRTRNDDLRHCFLTALARVDDAGEIVGYEAIIHDVTERKRVEEQLRHVQRIDAMGQLTGGVAHDFNNILTVILSNADLVRDVLPDEAPEVEGYLDELEGAAHRGTRLIGKLLAFARKEELVLLPVDLAEEARDIGRTLRRLLPANIEIRLFADEEMPPVQADPGALEQIVMNLATNARDAMPNGGVLWLNVSETEFAEEDRRTHGSWIVPGRYVCVSVSDSGMGMDPDTRERIFEPFYTTKSPGEGTGLGMAVIYGLVKQHNGFIHVYSEEGYGTTVKVYFPAAEADVEEQPEPTTTTGVPGGSETILVADDEEALRRAAARGLEKLGYTVHTAADGRAALEILARSEEEIDAVVTDLVMPHIGGAELLQALDREHPDTRVVVMSGYAGKKTPDGPDLSELLSRDRLHFLEKPWTISDLARAVRRVLDAS